MPVAGHPSPQFLGFLEVFGINLIVCRTKNSYFHIRKFIKKSVKKLSFVHNFITLASAKGFPMTATKRFFNVEPRPKDIKKPRKNNLKQ
jgi:hypothetical protein